jgi:hypothetical protein
MVYFGLRILLMNHHRGGDYNVRRHSDRYMYDGR